MKKRYTLFLLFLALLVQTAGAQTSKPTVLTFNFDDSALVQEISDNGLWGAAQATSAENANFSTSPRRVNIATGQVDDIPTGLAEGECFSCGVMDVTDDGNILVGQRNEMPAYFNMTTGTWTMLPMSGTCDGGAVGSVTPDGHYAVGRLTYSESLYREEACLWDLTTNTVVETPGLPTKDMASLDQGQKRFCEISSDGRRILGCMSFSYCPVGENLGGCFYFVYDRETSTYKPVGFREKDGERWEGLAENLYFISDATMSNNGKWVAGTAYVVRDGGELSGGSEADVPYLYDTEADTLSVSDADASASSGVWAVGNSGALYTATPSGTPIREWSVRSGKYDVGIDLILQQKYGYDFSALGFDNTGTPHSVSDDERVVCAMVDPYTPYILSVPDALYTLADGVDLLGSYSVSPAEGVHVVKLQNVSLTFSRKIDVLGAATSVQIRNAAGTALYQSVGVTKDATGKQLQITFRRGALEEGEAYTLYIPAGTICVAGDATMKNRAIEISYTGRADVPVSVQSVSPKSGATLARIDASTSPILLTFDVDIAVADTAYAELYRLDTDADGGEVLEKMNDLVLYYSGKVLAIASGATQYLYKGATYRVRIPAGCITDAAGSGGNEEVWLTYDGAYEREVSYDEKTIFSEDFNSGLGQMLLYDGDHLTPSTLMQSGWGFLDETNYPWWVVRDTETSTDMAAASHSMYTPAGQSDDWMVTPQLFIPDELCSVQFQAQSYLKSKTDVLRVYVYEDDAAYNVLTAALCSKMRQQGTLLLEQTLSPGDKEEVLEGDWQDFSLSLADFAGKNVYIAFVNENTDQSAVIVDNLLVKHDIPFLITIDTPSSVTAQESVSIKGRITIDTDDAPFTSLTVVLQDAAGQEVSRVEQTGVQLENGGTYAFELPEPLPLTVGQETAYRLLVRLDDVEKSVSGTVKNLAFSPKRHVVLEEFTGQGCQNCPLGILAIERLERLYGEQFIPLSLHTYSGDMLGTGLSTYSSYFGFSAAPSGVIDRNGNICFPMSSTSEAYVFNAPEGADALWGDVVAQEMETPADAEISATAALDEAGTLVNINVAVRYALDATQKNLNLFAAITEDDVLGYQQSNLASVTDENLGEWASGGIYASSVVYPYYHQDVVRGAYGTTVCGYPSLLPTELVAGEAYEAQLSLSLPATVDDVSKIHVTVLLINADTEGLVNAVRTAVQLPAGISEVEADASQPEAFFTLDGRRVSQPVRGINLVRQADGTVRKIINRE